MRDRQWQLNPGPTGLSLLSLTFVFLRTGDIPELQNSFLGPHGPDNIESTLSRFMFDRARCLCPENDNVSHSVQRLSSFSIPQFSEKEPSCYHVLRCRQYCRVLEARWLFTEICRC